jgi:hypothetical protein
MSTPACEPSAVYPISVNFAEAAYPDATAKSRHDSFEKANHAQHKSCARLLWAHILPMVWLLLLPLVPLSAWFRSQRARY